MRLGLSCAVIMLMIVVPIRLVAYSAELDNVQIPDTLQADGRPLQLNGYGLRTYSILAIHIYVASLYLEHLSTPPSSSEMQPFSS